MHIPFCPNGFLIFSLKPQESHDQGYLISDRLPNVGTLPPPHREGRVPNSIISDEKYSDDAKNIEKIKSRLPTFFCTYQRDFIETVMLYSSILSVHIAATGATEATAPPSCKNLDQQKSCYL